MKVYALDALGNLGVELGRSVIHPKEVGRCERLLFLHLSGEELPEDEHCEVVNPQGDVRKLPITTVIDAVRHKLLYITGDPHLMHPGRRYHALCKEGEHLHSLSGSKEELAAMLWRAQKRSLKFKVMFIEPESHQHDALISDIARRLQERGGIPPHHRKDVR